MRKIIGDLLKISRELVGNSGFFTDAEMSMPRVAHQETDNPEELYEQSQEVYGMLDSGRGRRIDGMLGLRRVYLLPDNMSQFFEDFDQFGSVLVIPPIKGRSRAEEKVESDYDGDWSRLVDIVRATIAVERYDELAPVVETLRESGVVLARRPEDTFMRPSAWGCRRLKMNIICPNGHIGELQLHLKGIFRVSVQDHELYEKAREIEVEAKKEGREQFTKDEMVLITGLYQVISDRYREAWENAMPIQASEPDVVAPFMGGGTTYYEYGGYPVEVRDGYFPVLLLKNRRVIVYDLLRFMRKAYRISKQDFDSMVEELRE